jgi:hypothetical protein
MATRTEEVHPNNVGTDSPRANPTSPSVASVTIHVKDMGTKLNLL